MKNFGNRGNKASKKSKKKMSTINTENIEQLLKIRESINKTIDKKIRECKIKDCLSVVDNMNLGELKNLFEGISYKLFDTRNGKKIIGDYVKSIKEDKSIKTLYSLYETLINPSYSSNPEVLVSSVCEIANNLPNYNSHILKLREAIKNGVMESGIDSEEFYSIIGKNKELNENLNYLFTKKSSVKNIYEKTEKIDSVVKYVKENMKKEDINENAAKTTSELKDELDEALTGLNVWETEAVRDLTLLAISGKDGKELFEKYKNECVNLLHEAINNTNDVSDAARFQTMKNSLSSKEYDADKLNESILKFAELKSLLSEECK